MYRRTLHGSVSSYTLSLSMMRVEGCFSNRQSTSIAFANTHPESGIMRLAKEVDDPETLPCITVSASPLPAIVIRHSR